MLPHAAEVSPLSRALAQLRAGEVSGELVRARRGGVAAVALLGSSRDGHRLSARAVHHRRHALRTLLAFCVPPLLGWAWASHCLSRLPATCAEAPGPCALCEFPLAASLPVGVTLAFLFVMAWIGEGLEASAPPLGQQARVDAVEAVLRGEAPASVAAALLVSPRAVEDWTAAWLQGAQAALEDQANAERGA